MSDAEAKRRKTEATQQVLAEKAPANFVEPFAVTLTRPAARELAVGAGCTVEAFAHACFVGSAPSLLSLLRATIETGGLAFGGPCASPRFGARQSTAPWLASGGRFGPTAARLPSWPPQVMIYPNYRR